MDRKQKPAFTILLIDDDPIFCRLVESTAQEMGIRLIHHVSVREAYADIPSLKYDLAILDYDLGRVTGVQLSHFMTRTKEPVPILLVSNYKDVPRYSWPESIRDFVSKSTGAKHVLQTALAIAGRTHTEEQ